MRRRGSFLLPGALVWVCGVAAGAAPADLEALLRSAVGQDHWYGLYLLGQKAGYAHAQTLETKVGARDAVMMRVDAHVKIKALGQRQDLRIAEQRVFLRTGPLHSIMNHFSGPGSQVKMTGVVEGDKLIVDSLMGSRASRKELPRPKEDLRDALAAARLVKPDAKIGDQVTIHQLHLMMLKEVDGTLTLKEHKQIIFNGVPTRIAVLRLRVPALGLTSDMFVDPRGVPLEMSLGKAFVLRLESEQQAKDIRYTSDVVRLGCIRLSPPPRQVAQCRRLRLRIEGITKDLTLIDDPRQQWARQPDGSYVVTVRVPHFEPLGAARLPADPQRFAAELKPSLFCQSDDPRIKALATRVVGGERDAYLAAVKIARWVYRNLRKVGTAAISNAVETLESRQGDCTEHTVLFVALARAAGIPAREVSGVTAIERGEGLYFHAWAEVWVGQWIAIDPTLGQTIADATHIKFAEGGADQQSRILGFIGTLKAKVLAD